MVAVFLDFSWDVYNGTGEVHVRVPHTSLHIRITWRTLEIIPKPPLLPSRISFNVAAWGLGTGI